MRRRAKPSSKPTTRVRQILTQLGYVEHEDFEYEVEIRLYSNRRLYADVMLFQGDTPIAVVEVEGKPSLLRDGFEEARFKGAAWNLENPVPLLWVAAGERDMLYRLTRPCRGICYVPLSEQKPLHALAPAQLATLIGDYLQQTDAPLGQSLRDRNLLRDALQAASGKDPRTRFVNLLTALQSQQPKRGASAPLREAHQRVAQARQKGKNRLSREPEPEDSEQASLFEDSRYRRGRRKPSVAIEVLFLERFFQLCKPGGVVAIIAPRGIAANRNLMYVRKWLIMEHSVRCILEPDVSAFKGVGANALTSIFIADNYPSRRGDRAMLATLPPARWELSLYAPENERLLRAAHLVQEAIEYARTMHDHPREDDPDDCDEDDDY